MHYVEILNFPVNGIPFFFGGFSKHLPFHQESRDENLEEIEIPSMEFIHQLPRRLSILDSPYIR